MEQLPKFYKKIYADESPYPETAIAMPNRNDGLAMLDNFGGSNSEMSAIGLYVYDNLIMSEYSEVTVDFIRIAMVEMHHLHIFGELAVNCGEDPRLWTKRGNRNIYWSPSYNKYSTSIAVLLQNAIESEKAAIQKYEAQIKFCNDITVKDNLRRIILDEQLHVEIFTDLFNRYVK